MKLIALAPQGLQQTVATANISTLIAFKQSAVRVAVVANGTYHLLTGMIDKKETFNRLTVISDTVLKRALAETLDYTERQQKRREETGESTRNWGAHIQGARFR